MAKDWIYKRLTSSSSARLGEDRPDYFTNDAGDWVRTHAPYPITPPEDRLKRKIKLAHYDGEDFECWEWNGGSTFRVSEAVITTPARFAYEYSTGEILMDHEALFQTCKGCNCIRPIHQRKAKSGAHNTSVKKAFYIS